MLRANAVCAMSRGLLALCVLAPFALVLAAGTAWGDKNSYGMWALDYAGPHSAKGNTCESRSTDCYVHNPTVSAPAGPGDFDVYIVAVEVEGIAGTTFGLYGEGSFFFEPSGWRKCADFEVSWSGWPGCGAGVTVAWSEEQPGPNVNIGILHVYAYGEGRIWTGPDPRGPCGLGLIATPVVTGT